jgi:hypothetical protein
MHANNIREQRWPNRGVVGWGGWGGVWGRGDVSNKKNVLQHIKESYFSFLCGERALCSKDNGQLADLVEK